MSSCFPIVIEWDATFNYNLISNIASPKQKKGLDTNLVQRAGIDAPCRAACATGRRHNYYTQTTHTNTIRVTIDGL